MNKKHFYTAVILLLFLAIGTKTTRAINIPGDDAYYDVDGSTYTLKKNVSETIQIVSNGITLDGAGHTVSWESGTDDQGVYIQEKDDVTIKNLIVQNFDNGIQLVGGSNNNFIGNTVSGSVNGSGILISNSNNMPCAHNTLTENIVFGNNDGIQLYQATNNTLTNNTAHDNTHYAIYLRFSNNNTLENNTANDNPGGIVLDTSCENNLTSNTVLRNVVGILLWDSCNDNTLTGNTASNNQYGIKLKNSSNNTMTDNDISDNDWGIWLDPSNENTVKCNDISLNTHGIYIKDSMGNQIYNNNFIDNTNTPQAEVVGGTGNLFNLGDPTEGGEGGNYWSDWSGSGPYVIVLDVVQDEFPWAVQDGWLDTIPPIISCPGNTVIVGPDGVPVDDERIQTFLNGASATDNCDPEPTITNNAPDVFPPGDTVVTFTATDAAGNSSSCSSTVTVVDTEGNLRIIPSIINREGRLEKILAVIRFPEGTTEEDIDIGQPLILYPGDSLNGIEATSQRIVTWYMWGTLRVSVFASFSKDEVTADVPDGLAEMMVIGRFDDSADGEYFYGFDNVWIISWDW